MSNKLILSQLIAIIILLILLGGGIFKYYKNVSNYKLISANNQDFGFYKIINGGSNKIISEEYLKMIDIEAKKNIENQLPKFSAISSIDIPVIMYHHIHPDFINSKDAILAGLTVSPIKFEQDLKDIKESGYITIFPQEVFDVFNGKLDPSKNYIVLTIDDGYLDNYQFAFDILKKYQMKAVIYIIANRMGKSVDNNDYFSWEQAKEMLNSGYVAIGSHTMDHKDLSSIDEDELKYQIIDSKKMIEENLGINILDFCYPYGRYNDRAVKLVEEAGYNNSTTTAYGFERKIANRYLWPRVRGNQNYSIKGFL